MVTTLADLDITKPDGSTEPVSVLDNYERETKEAVITSYAVEHDLDGPHTFLFGNTAARPAAGYDGRIYFNTQTNTLQRDNGSSWDDIVHFGQRVHVGTYTGTGAGQAITGLGFQPDYLRVVPLTGTNPSFTKTLDHVTTASHQDDDGATIATGITVLGADGFTVGVAADVVGVVYDFLAIENNT